MAVFQVNLSLAGARPSRASFTDSEEGDKWHSFFQSGYEFSFKLKKTDFVWHCNTLTYYTTDVKSLSLVFLFYARTVSSRNTQLPFELPPLEMAFNRSIQDVSIAEIVSLQLASFVLMAEPQLNPSQWVLRGLLFMAALRSRCGHYIFPCGFFLLLLAIFFFIPCLILAAILLHMLWPLCEFRMQVWNVLHAARCKCRTQKSCQKSPSRHHRTTLSGYIFTPKACVDNRKKNVKQQYLLHMSPHGPLAAEIVSLVWGTPGNFNGFASWQRYCMAL